MGKTISIMQTKHDISSVVNSVSIILWTGPLQQFCLIPIIASKGKNGYEHKFTVAWSCVVQVRVTTTIDHVSSAN